MLKLRDKFKIRHMMKREPLLLSHHAKTSISLVHLGFQTLKKLHTDNIDTFPE